RNAIKEKDIQIRDLKFKCERDSEANRGLQGITKQLEEKITSLLSADVILAELRKEAEKVNQSQVPEMMRSSSVIQKLHKDDSSTRSSGETELEFTDSMC
ncbi:hypothetical protein FOZ62_018829, partial [Perkinsus olseni]